MFKKQIQSYVPMNEQEVQDQKVILRLELESKIQTETYSKQRMQKMYLRTVF